jgi:prophage DNA circulation protein
MASPSLIDKMEKLLTDSLIPNAQTLIDKIKEVDKAAYDVVKTFGLSNSQVMAIKSSLTGAASEVERLGGKFSDVLSIQTQLGEITNRNAILMSESFAGIYAASEVSGQTVKEMGKSFKDTGFSLYSISEQMEGVVNTARSIGVNTQAVSSQRSG